MMCIVEVTVGCELNPSLCADVHRTALLLISVFQGPRCLVKCRDQTTAPAPAGGARILNKGNRYPQNRSGSRRSLKRRRPRSPAKLLLSFQPVPRGTKDTSQGCEVVFKKKVHVTLLLQRNTRTLIEVTSQARLKPNPGFCCTVALRSGQEDAVNPPPCLSGFRRNLQK